MTRLFNPSPGGILAALVAGAVAVAWGQEGGPGEPDPFADLPPKEAAIERMFSERGEAGEFEAAVAAARRHGASDQVILEARFLYHVDRREDARIAAMAAEVLARRDKFRPDESMIFAVREDWLAVVEYVQAIAALQKDDRGAFKHHITEAFWLSPRQAAAFAPHIERMRMEEAMSKVRIDFSTRLRLLDGGDRMALADVMRDRKALVLHFWSPWSRECEEFAADFAATARALDRRGIAVASVLAEDDERVLADAREQVARTAAGVPARWLRDSDTDPLHARLRVQSVPVFVVVATDGRVLFNGHPAEDACWQALRSVAPEVERPALESTH